MGYGQYSEGHYEALLLAEHTKKVVRHVNRKQKRRKYVFPSWEIAAVWIAQEQDSARNPQGNFYFSRETIYSYGSHFPIAVITDRQVNGKTLVLLTNRRYSSTTAGHIHNVQLELQKHSDKYVVVRLADTEWCGIEYAKENYKKLVESYQDKLEAATRAYAQRADRLVEADAIREEINIFRQAYLKGVSSCRAIRRPDNYDKDVKNAQKLRQQWNVRLAYLREKCRQRLEELRKENEFQEKLRRVPQLPAEVA